MRKRLAAMAAAVVGAVLLVGCGAQPGRTVVTQGAQTPPIMGTAPETGNYALYTSLSPNATATVKLNAGDPLGFRRTGDGRLEGVAGDQTFPLGKATAQAYWKLRK
jgi:hypothetical protein